MSIEEIVRWLEDIRNNTIPQGHWCKAVNAAIALLKTHPDAQPNEPLTLEGGTAELMKKYLDLGSIDHLQELAQAEKGGRLVVLPEVWKDDLDAFKDGLEDYFKDAADYAPDVGIFGMRDGETKLANALMEALRSYDALGPWNT